MSLWATCYVESWKRTQAALTFLWGLDEQSDQMSRAEQRKQRETTIVIDKKTSLRTYTVLKTNEWRNFFESLGLLLFFSFFAVLLWVFLFKAFKPLYKPEGEDAEIVYYYVWVVIYSYATIQFSSLFSKAAVWISDREN